MTEKEILTNIDSISVEEILKRLAAYFKFVSAGSGADPSTELDFSQGGGHLHAEPAYPRIPKKYENPPLVPYDRSWEYAPNQEILRRRLQIRPATERVSVLALGHPSPNFSQVSVINTRLHYISTIIVREKPEAIWSLMEDVLYTNYARFQDLLLGNNPQLDLRDFRFQGEFPSDEELNPEDYESKCGESLLAEEQMKEILNGIQELIAAEGDQSEKNEYEYFSEEEEGGIRQEIKVYYSWDDFLFPHNRELPFLHGMYFGHYGNQLVHFEKAPDSGSRIISFSMSTPWFNVAELPFVAPDDVALRKILAGVWYLRMTHVADIPHPDLFDKGPWVLPDAYDSIIRELSDWFARTF